MMVTGGLLNPFNKKCRSRARFVPLRLSCPFS
jgi:hypothetical protein